MRRKWPTPLNSFAMREFELLQHIYAANSTLDERVLIGPGDDMAMIQLQGRRLLAAVDQLIDGRHVQLARTPLELVGRKAVTRSLSDIAAMAAQPVATLAAAALPPNFGEDRAKVLFDSMRATAQMYCCPLIGGDISIHRDPSHPLICTVTVLAEAVANRVATRSQAQAGDTVYVTGHLGGSLQPDGLGRHLTFEPRIREALAISETLGDRLHAMIDISDGLGRDASHIAKMSGVQIRLHADHLPCNPGCDWKNALGDGEDYELCFTATGDVPKHVGGLEVTPVGDVLPRDRTDQRLVLVQHGDELINGDEFGWQHES